MKLNSFSKRMGRKGMGLKLLLGSSPLLEVKRRVLKSLL